MINLTFRSLFQTYFGRTTAVQGFITNPIDTDNNEFGWNTFHPYAEKCLALVSSGIRINHKQQINFYIPKHSKPLTHAVDLISSSIHVQLTDLQY
jgi:hypothetical protein